MKGSKKTSAISFFSSNGNRFFVTFGRIPGERILKVTKKSGNRGSQRPDNKTLSTFPSLCLYECSGSDCLAVGFLIFILSDMTVPAWRTGILSLLIFKLGPTCRENGRGKSLTGRHSILDRTLLSLGLTFGLFTWKGSSPRTESRILSSGDETASQSWWWNSFSFTSLWIPLPPVIEIYPDQTRDFYRINPQSSVTLSERISQKHIDS